MLETQYEETEMGFKVVIEDNEHGWHKETITVAEIRQLSGIGEELVVIVEEEDGSERTLAEVDVIILKQGHRFGRGSRYKRG
jgi:hypothetical protein